MSEGLVIQSPRYSIVEKRTIDGHDITVRYANQESIQRLKERIEATEFTDDFVRSPLGAFVQFLELPMVTDDFGTDHFARTDWRNELLTKGLREEYDFLDTGVLRGNNLGGVLPHFEGIKRLKEDLDRYAVVNGQDPAALWTIVEAGMKLKQEMDEKYETMTQPQRERFVERVAAIVELATLGLVKLFEKKEIT
ncbi:MAG: hypothetical protein AAB440_01725 [Patescibacteria group bacterium]